MSCQMQEHVCEEAAHASSSQASPPEQGAPAHQKQTTSKLLYDPQKIPDPTRTETLENASE